MAGSRFRVTIARLGTFSTAATNVNIVVPLDVALGLSDLPGELVGYGPIPASLCRDAVNHPTATTIRFVVNPLGELVDCSTAYKPSQALTDKIIARDRRCTFTSCYPKACRCELDHIEPFNGHNTVEDNLQPLCCRHHHVRHDAGWTPKRRDDGVTEWTSPTGRVYEKPPEPYPGTEPQPPPPKPKPDEDPPPF